MSKAIKAYISIRMKSGEVITYINKFVNDSLGKNELCYSYTNEIGDKFEDQTGNGKIKGDYDSLISQIGVTGLINWPEDTGTVLIRKNFKQDSSKNSRVFISVNSVDISSIKVIENEISEFE